MPPVARFDSTQQLFGLVDPSDGIPFRPPTLAPADDSRRLYPTRPGIVVPKDDRCVYRKGRRYTVRVRVCGKLHNLGVFATIAEARRARDAFRQRMLGAALVKCKRTLPE